MRFTFSLKNLSLGLAMVSLSAGAAFAQSLTGVNARLVRPLDSQTAAQGQPVTAKLDGSVKTADGVKLPKGTELIGKIADVPWEICQKKIGAKAGHFRARIPLQRILCDCRFMYVSFTKIHNPHLIIKTDIFLFINLFFF